MGKIVTKSIQRTYRNLIKQVVKDLGEAIQLYYDPEETFCPNCLWDVVSGKSKGIYNTSFVTPVTIYGKVVNPKVFSRARCPVCLGEGKLLNYTPIVVQALVKWAPADSEMERTVAGDEGRNIVRVKARKSYYIRLRDCRYAIIDGVRCELIRPPTLRGLGKTDEIVVAYFEAVEVGKSVKE